MPLALSPAGSAPLGMLGRIIRLGAALACLSITLPAVAQEQGQPPKVSIAAAYTEEITDEAVFIGRGEAIDKVDIVARVNGFLEKRHVEDGQPVNKGDLLFEIEPYFYQAALDAANADQSRGDDPL